MSGDKLITVCAACLTAACWQGVLMCDAATTADVVEKTVAELRQLGRESGHWWDIDPETG